MRRSYLPVRAALRAVCAIGFAAVLAGCGEQASVSYAFFEDPGFEVELLVVEFTDGRRTVRLTGSDFDPDGNRRDTREYATRTTGRLETRFWLVHGVDTLSRGQFDLDLRPDFRWNVNFSRESEDPTATCFGCFGRLAFELAPELQGVPADSVWVVWGGNSISSPVVY